MAISSGVGPHYAWIDVNGQSFPVTRGSVTQEATKRSSTFDCEIPMQYPGAYGTFATLSDNSASIVVSTRGITGSLVTGEIDEPHFGYKTQLIQIRGRCQSAKLHGSKSSEKWANRKGSDIVQELASRAGLTVSADASALLAGKQVQIDWVKLSDNISLASVIHKLAEFDGARWWVRNGVLYYKSKDDATGVYSVTYKPPTEESPMMGDFLGLGITYNVQAGKGANVTVKSWHPKKKQVFTGQATVGQGGVQYQFHIPNLLQDHAQQWAQSKAEEISRHGVTIEADLVGDPTIDVGMGFQVNGTTYFDMTYPMDSIHHSFGERGHTMTVTARSKKDS